MFLKLSQLEFNTFYILTIILVIFKFIIVAFLAVKIYQRKKETGQFTIGFAFGVLILMICLIISRLFYIIFDFYLTKFDPNKYYLVPNVIIWKIASFISLIGFAVFIYITDRKILSFKFKGAIAYIILIMAVIQLSYPVNSAQDFQLISTLNAIANIIGVVIPIFFFSLGWKPSPYRRASFAIAFGVIIYAIGSNITIEFFLALIVNVWGGQTRIIIYLISLILKVSGLTLFSYGVSEFVVKFSK